MYICMEKKTENYYSFVTANCLSDIFQKKTSIKKGKEKNGKCCRLNTFANLNGLASRLKANGTMCQN
jgi:hypothetical protein